MGLSTEMQLMQRRAEGRDLTNDVTHKAQVNDWLDATDSEGRMVRP
jgi:cytidylate kinase